MLLVAYVGLRATTQVESYNIKSKSTGSRKATGLAKGAGWYKYNSSETVIVFVHGILSDAKSAWTNNASNSFWPELVESDPLFKQPSIFLGEYYTSLSSGPFSIRDAANELYLKLKVPIGTREPVISKKNVLFIAHSMGGIVVRQMLLQRISEFTSKNVGLVLIASPSIGSKDANRLSWLSNAARNNMAMNLTWNNSYLEELDKDFKNLVYEEKIPCLSGVEAVENYLIGSKLLGLVRNEVLVEANSAGRYFGEVRRLPNTDHASAVKPENIHSASHLLLQDYYISDFLPRCDELKVNKPHLEVATKNDESLSGKSFPTTKLTDEQYQGILLRLLRLDVFGELASKKALGNLYVTVNKVRYTYPINSKLNKIPIKSIELLKDFRLPFSEAYELHFGVQLDVDSEPLDFVHGGDTIVFETPALGLKQRLYRRSGIVGIAGGEIEVTYEVLSSKD